MDIDPKYIDVTIRRWQEMSGEVALLEGDGRTFEQVAAERVVASVEVPACHDRD